MAYVLSSVSGNLISAASAGYAPTNSGDVSAIASAYQVVSATATQLYAGTAYVTSVNDAPISAARAGNAANASLANSAWYDGTGRLISALPDSAAVSAIASSYVESGVSSKQDTLSFAYNAADQISSINGSALGGMDEAAVSGIASAYAESAVSSKADSSALSSYALSADVSGTVDLVSTQSANWGGSALALSAGQGVTLSKSGDTLTISTETVLWSGTPVTVDAATAGLILTESPYNFDRVALYWVPWNYSVNSLEKQEAVAEAKITSAIPRIGSVTEWNAEATNTMFMFVLNAYFDSAKFYTQAVRYFAIGDWAVNTQGTGSYITKIVGINRTAEA